MAINLRVISLSLFLLTALGCAAPQKPDTQTGKLPEDKDLRLSYQLLPETFWQSVDSMRIVVDSIAAHHLATAKSGDADDLLSMLVSGNRPASDGAEIFEMVPRNTTLELSNGARYKTLPLRVLNSLPSGYLFSLRLRIREVVVTSLGRENMLVVPPRWQSPGLPIAINGGFAPVCGDYITSLTAKFDSTLFRLGPAGMELAEAAYVRADLTAPAVVLSDGGAIEVPGATWVRVPPMAVVNPILLRLSEIPPSGITYSDPAFTRTTRQVALIFDFKPDVQLFQAPVEIALDIPHQYEITAETIDTLREKGVPAPVLSVLSGLRGRAITGERNFIELVRRTLGADVSYLYLVLKDSVRSTAILPRSLTLFTYTPSLGVWTPDVPGLLPEHQEMVIAELDRVIAAKEASSNLADHFPPDYSGIPVEPYQGLELGEINKQEQDGYLVTLSNHFCAKSLFADLEHAADELYEPLLDGALDNMCQTGLLGWAIDGNDDVHCGHNLPSAADIRQANRKTRRIIDRNGVALRLRNSARDYFENTTCAAANSLAYCYNNRDFEDDIRWAVEMWREAINRNPDGSYTERFHINCWKFEDDDAGCTGDEIDVNIRDMNDWAHTLGKNITLREDVVDDAMAGFEGRVELRHTLLHELGHVLGLHHWAGPGTLMSQIGRQRRNLNRENVCAPFTQSQWQTAGDPTSLTAGLASDCNVDVYNDHPGTTTLAWNHRIATLSCTDIDRIRTQINDGADWARCEPLQCEILTEQTEYAALELPEYDAGTGEYYTALDFDLGFAHCGSADDFDRLELEMFPINADNTLNSVVNLYGDIVEIEPLTRGAGDVYAFPVRLDSRNLVRSSSSVGPAVTVFPSFSDYIQGNNASGQVYPNIGMVLRAFNQTDGSGALDEFVVASTGLLRSPVLDPVATPITFGIVDMIQSGESAATDALRDEFEDFVSTEDLFPYIDNALRKPNVGRVLYVTVPPRNNAFDDNEYADGNYKLEFQWSVPGGPEGQFEGGPSGPARIWIDNIEIRREEIPIVSDWGTAGGPVTDPVWTTPEDLDYSSDPSLRDPCVNISGRLTLPALRDEPVYHVDLPTGEEIEVWDLYNVAVHYDFVHYTDPITGGPCTAPDVCAPTANCDHGPLTAARTENFYVSIAGPTGAITKPLGIDSLCLIQSPRDGQSYEVAAEVPGLAMLPELFPEHEFQVKLRGTGEVLGNIRTEIHQTANIFVDDLPEDGRIGLPAKWNNNELNHDFNVTLRYRHRLRGAAEWGDWVVLDQLDLRIDADNNCDSGPITYEEVCSFHDDDYECGSGI
jgi:hypothetical protein